MKELRATGREPRAGQKPEARSSKLVACVPADRHRLCRLADMTRKTALFTIGSALLTFTHAQGDKPQPTSSEQPAKIFHLRTVSHNAFQAGEKLTYVLHYGFVDAGEATLELTKSDQSIQGRPIFKA